MSSFFNCGTVPMSPEMDKLDVFGSGAKDTFKVPAIYFEGMNDMDKEEPEFDWLMDSVAMIKDQYIVKYIESTFFELLLKGENGENEWVDGRSAAIEGIDIEGHKDIRVAKEYLVVVYDLEKGERKRGKVVFEEPSPMDKYDFYASAKYYPANGPLI